MQTQPYMVWQQGVDCAEPLRVQAIGTVDAARTYVVGLPQRIKDLARDNVAVTVCVAPDRCGVVEVYNMRIQVSGARILQSLGDLADATIDEGEA